ncbi:hypothetical protein OJF2_53400 [Aquisphaera giovannonii]|uniref:Uncharacterized protein n=1 Tax=Aquisphaera giovannonii TaxID=406548 RepID=A0A5B9W9I5_9BACT|nr:hypothetical protein [Aquisphaera giovannonii]QEH36755.1 hypothetical protein OJF2_53400 [Aquisphaera giovannonii]
MLDAVLHRALKGRVRKRRVRLAAIEGMAMGSHELNRYFTKRQTDGGGGVDRP